MQYSVSFKSEAELAQYLTSVEAERVPGAGEMYVTTSYRRDRSAVSGFLRQVATLDGDHASFIHEHEALDLKRAA